MERADSEVEDERLKCKGLRGDLGIIGLVPARLRTSAVCGDKVVAPIDGDSGVVLNCAAEKEVRSRLRGVVEPLIGGDANEVMSSPFADGPAEEKCDPFCDLASVDEVPWLPLRFRFIYFSIASASRSRIRVAIGDNEKGGPAARTDEDCEGAAE
jgi:hypothetical protein